MKFHGNYCGPNWSAGKEQVSVVSDVMGVDWFDEECRKHDFAYATNQDLYQADRTFVQNTIFGGVKPALAGAAVGTQLLLRDMIYPSINKNKDMSKQNKQNLRGSTKPQQTKQNNTIRPQNKNDKVSAAPVAFATQRVGMAPKITANGGSFRVAHRAYLGAISNTTDFTVTPFAANPGLPNTFPWLHRIARRYEEYRFRKLSFEFRSVCASNTPGVVMMSYDYDAADASPSTKAAQSQTVPAIENNVWINSTLDVPCTGNFRYVRSGNLGANLDIKTYDYGQMFISTSYGSASGTVGEIYVHYDVEFRYPTEGANTCGKAIVTTGISKVSPFGAGLTFDPQTNASPFEYLNTTSIKITQPGEYLMVAQLVGTFTPGTTVSPLFTTSASTSAWTSLGGALVAGGGYHSMLMRVASGDVLSFQNLTDQSYCSVLNQVTVRFATIDYDSMI